jgi:hypothetical protein
MKFSPISVPISSLNEKSLSVDIVFNLQSLLYAALLRSPWRNERFLWMQKNFFSRQLALCPLVQSRKVVIQKYLISLILSNVGDEPTLVSHSDGVKRAA